MNFMSSKWLHHREVNLPYLFVQLPSLSSHILYTFHFCSQSFDYCLGFITMGFINLENFFYLNILFNWSPIYNLKLLSLASVLIMYDRPASTYHPDLGPRTVVGGILVADCILPSHPGDHFHIVPLAADCNYNRTYKQLSILRTSDKKDL